MSVIVRTLVLVGTVSSGIVSLAGYSHPAPPPRPQVITAEAPGPTAKADRLPVFSRRWEPTAQLPPSAVRVRLIPLNEQPAPAVRRLVAEPEPEPEPQRRRHADNDERHHPGDVCERHHLRKVSIRGGRSWRCRR